MNILSNKYNLSFYILTFYFCLVPFHYYVANQFYFYKEFFSIIFLFFAFNLSSGSDNKNKVKIISYYSFFILIICVAAFFDPNIALYDENFANVSKSLATFSPKLYVIRNSVISIPVLLLLYRRGLTKDEIVKMSKILAIIAPISIINYLYYYNITSIFRLDILLSLGGTNMDYNSFVPSLTFPFMCSVFVTTTTKIKRTKLLFSTISAIILIYIIVSTSRQSVLFCILVILLFSYYNKILLSNFLQMILVFTLFYYAFSYIITNITTDAKLVSRFSSMTGFFESGRDQDIIDGLKRLDLIDYFFGAGLTSVIQSGPHNDYIRWLQRIGIFGSFFSFLAWFKALTLSFQYSKEHKNSFAIFLMCAILFTLFHSLFGYPREDAYQAPYCFLGLGMILSIKYPSKFEK